MDYKRKLDYKILGNVVGVIGNKSLKQGYRLVEFTRDNIVQIGVEQQFGDESWGMTQGQWCKEEVIDVDAISIDFGQEWGVKGMQKVLK